MRENSLFGACRGDFREFAETHAIRENTTPRHELQVREWKAPRTKIVRLKSALDLLDTVGKTGDECKHSAGTHFRSQWFVSDEIIRKSRLRKNEKMEKQESLPFFG